MQNKKVKKRKKKKTEIFFLQQLDYPNLFILIFLKNLNKNMEISKLILILRYQTESTN